MNKQMGKSGFEIMKKGGDIMRNAIKIFLPALLLGLCLSIPALVSAAGNKHTGTVLRTPEAKAKTIIITPPKEFAHANLKAEDRAATVVNKWYCHSAGLDIYNDEVKGNYEWTKSNDKDLKADGISGLNRTVNQFLDHQKEDAVKFWAFYMQPEPWEANPAQGQSVSKTWKHCYSEQELELAKLGAIRWAHYIKDVYLPGLKSKK